MRLTKELFRKTSNRTPELQPEGMDDNFGKKKKKPKSMLKMEMYRGK